LAFSWPIVELVGRATMRPTAWRCRMASGAMRGGWERVYLAYEAWPPFPGGQAFVSLFIDLLFCSELTTTIRSRFGLFPTKKPFRPLPYACSEPYFKPCCCAVDYSSLLLLLYPLFIPYYLFLVVAVGLVVERAVKDEEPYSSLFPRALFRNIVLFQEPYTF
jgi:hypothetical protein